MTTPRSYVSQQRSDAAEDTKKRVLQSAKTLFARHGIDAVSIAAIGDKAGVATSTVYALFKSKDGLLQAITRGALFGPRYKAALSIMDGVTDAAKLVALTAKVARAIYESESEELGLVRGASAFSPALRKIEQELEDLRYDMQAARLKLLFEQRKAKAGLDIDTARRIMWMYTSREIYRMLVREGGWSADAYEAWLERTLCEALVKPAK